MMRRALIPALVPVVVVLALALLLRISAAPAATPPATAAAEYSVHLNALSQLSVAVAEAMPDDKYAFRPHPDSMDYGQLISHIATTNYQFCAGLQDSNPPSLPSPTTKDAVVKFLSDSFQYCSGVINGLTTAQLDAAHNSPDGRLPGREVLLAIYVHVAHHRGQAEMYLRVNGIKPPNYRI